MDQEEIDTSTKKNNFPKFTDDLEGENFENKNLNIENLREKIKLLDTTQYKIEGTSLEIITQIYSYPELLKNIIRMIVEELKKDYLERIPFLYLISDIFNRWKNDFNLKKTTIKLPEEVFQEVIDIIQFISRTIDTRTQIEIETILKIWEDNKIYTKKQIDIIKFYIKLVLEPELKMNDDENKILFELISTNVYSIDRNLINFSNEIDFLNNENNMNDDNINQHRFNVLNMSKDYINAQMNIFSTYIKYVNVIDSILDKIENFKNNYNEDNNNNNFNL
jgi:hypothetical protein